jgi:hypothetical protein
MLATLSTLTLIPLVACVGVCVPILGLHLELAYRREQRQGELLHAQADAMKEHETTINAYRRALSLAMSEAVEVTLPIDS